MAEKRLTVWRVLLRALFCTAAIVVCFSLYGLAMGARHWLWMGLVFGGVGSLGALVYVVIDWELKLKDGPDVVVPLAGSCPCLVFLLLWGLFATAAVGELTSGGTVEEALRAASDTANWMWGNLWISTSGLVVIAVALLLVLTVRVQRGRRWAREHSTKDALLQGVGVAAASLFLGWVLKAAVALTFLGCGLGFTLPLALSFASRLGNLLWPAEEEEES